MNLFILFTLCTVSMPGASGVETDEAFANMLEGNLVTLHTGAKINHRDRIKWYFNETRIAQITGDQNNICRDVRCQQRFRDRLTLDSHTGDLTITNIHITDSGVYKLHILRRRVIEKIFNLAVCGVSAAERNEVRTKSVKKGESVTLDPGVLKNTNYVMVWYFNDKHVAEITRVHSKICADNQCDERFRDGLEINNQTGSLTITNTRSTHSGQYKVKIVYSISHRYRISIVSVKTFSVTVIDSSLISGMCAAVLVLLVAVTVACLKRYCCRRYYEHG